MRVFGKAPTLAAKPIIDIDKECMPPLFYREKGWCPKGLPGGGGGRIMRGKFQKNGNGNVIACRLAIVLASGARKGVVSNEI